MCECCKIAAHSNLIQKKSSVQDVGRKFIWWVIEGARTPDPQNHNLML